MVISEAFAYGIPVISTDIAGIPDMMQDGKEGYLLAPGDREKMIFAMDSLYRDVGGDLRSNMSKACRAKFESTFDVELMVAHYRKLINKVCIFRLLLVINLLINVTES
jgi:glycosyltransferase involved in cell wall biosynthesis